MGQKTKADGPGPGNQLLVIAIIFTLCAVVVYLTTGCGLYEAVVGTVEESQETLKQGQRTMAAIESVSSTLEFILVGIGSYFLGEVRRPAIKSLSKVLNGKGKKKPS